MWPTNTSESNWCSRCAGVHVHVLMCVCSRGCLRGAGMLSRMSCWWQLLHERHSSCMG
jgi:hypothetical protein